MMLTMTEMEEEAKKQEQITMLDIQQQIQTLIDYGEAKVDISDILSILTFAKKGIEQADQLKQDGKLEEAETLTRQIFMDALYGNSQAPTYQGLQELVLVAMNNEVPMVLGDMSESLYRMSIGEGFKLSHVKKVFGHLLEVGKELKRKENVK